MITNVKIESLDNVGKGISHLDGKIIFIPNTLPGEIVNIKIIKTSAKFLLGKVTSFVKKSSDRNSNFCPFFDSCGGCTFSLDYDYQINYKLNNVKTLLKKYANIDVFPEIIKSDNITNYRNKIELKIENYQWGYYNNGTHEFTTINKCNLAKKSINKIISNQKSFNIKNGNIIIRSNFNDEILIKIDTKDSYNIDIDALKKDNIIIGITLNDKIIYGEDEFVEKVNNYYFKVNINSFFQVNINILEKILILLNNEDLKTVVDLYCGVGVLGISLKKDKLYGIEVVPEAIKNAIINAKVNHQDNNYYLLGDSSNISKINAKIDSLIIDPPRSGLNKKTLDEITKLNINNIIYMSCNPITFARDLNVLKETFKIKKMYLCDMFPNTYHVECVCILNLLSNIS